MATEGKTGDRFLVTGALGCIGAWVVKTLVDENMATSVLDLARDPHRLKLIMDREPLERVRFISGDITDLDVVTRAFAASGATHVIHLAGLQVPFCKADPSLGARVNVVGTVNVFEAARRAGLRRVVYASSTAVYGQSEEYPEPRVGDAAAPRPLTHYGVYKLANEGTARIYFQDDGITSIGLRPYVVYGPERDQGMTSAPTMAMLAAALGQSYRISFGGRCAYQYVQDVARLFIQAARVPFDEARVFNLRGSVVSMAEIVQAIETVEPAMRGAITFQEQPLPYPQDFDDTSLKQALGALPDTPLLEGVRQTISIYKRASAEGRLPESLTSRDGHA